MSDPDERIFDWRLVKAGEVAPLKGGHGSWVETDHPAVIACMGSAPECAANGCQAERWQQKVQELEAKLAITEGDYRSMYDTATAAVKRIEEESALRAAAESRVLALEAEKDMRQLEVADLRIDLQEAEAAIARLRAALKEWQDAKRNVDAVVREMNLAEKQTEPMREDLRAARIRQREADAALATLTEPRREEERES